MPSEPIFFSDKETYKFFQYNYGEIHPNPHSSSFIKTYSRFHDSDFTSLKKKFKALASLYGNEYSQRLLYYHLTLDRFLRLCVPVNRLSSLLNEMFQYFERYMYLQLNWSEGEDVFYRDHSLHTANEAYLGYSILKENKQLFIKMRDFLRQDNPITRYISDHCRIGTSYALLDFLIYRTWFISALFHDLGYVLHFHRKISKEMHSFNRLSDLILRAERSNFSDIQLLLGNSLLFSTIHIDKIEEAYNSKKHGVLSAFLLLATYYTPPSFDGVATIDRVAIELAARSIFYHDTPDEKGPVIDTNKIMVKHTKNKYLEPWGDYSSFLIHKKKGSDIGDVESFLVNRKISPIGSFEFDIKSYEKTFLQKTKTSERCNFHIDPFAFFLRFIDEIQSFGRIRILDFPNKDETHVSEYSYPAPALRNLVTFPAQIIRFLDPEKKKLQIFCIADASLFLEHKPGTIADNPLFDTSGRIWNKEAAKFTLKEWYWLTKCGVESKIFNEIHFYYVETWGSRDP